MRLSAWGLMIWVILTVLVAAGGSYFSYTQARERTRQLNEVARLDEGVNVVRTVKLLAGWEKPQLSDVIAEAPDATQPSIAPTTPPTEPVATGETSATPDPEATEEPSTPDPAASPEATQDSSAITADEAILNDPRRVTVLLMGIDQRQGEAGPFRTDTMMVLSLDPIAQTGVMLSIPRDLWIDYEGGYGLAADRINNANVAGESIQYPGGGPEFAKRTVERLIGQRIHYYVLVNFDAFITLVNVIGDVEVCPPAPIDDPKYPDGSYGYKHVTFEAGCQELGAERLLEYARTRATSNGDVDRAGRQQETILAIRQKVTTLGGVANFLTEALTIWDSIQANVRTDLNLNQLVALARLAQDIPPENIRNATIGYGEVELGTGPNGEEILVPIKSDILALVSELFQ